MTDKSCLFRCTTIIVYLVVILQYLLGLAKIILGTVFLTRPDLRPQPIWNPLNPDYIFFVEWIITGVFSILLGSLLLAGAIMRKPKFVAGYLVVTTIVLVFVSVAFVASFLNDPTSLSFHVFVASFVSDPTSQILQRLALLGFCWVAQVFIYWFYERLCEEGVDENEDKSGWKKFENES